MLDAATYPTLRARRSPGLPIEKLIVGQSVEAAAALLPRLFNLCRVAQGLAARAAFGLPLDADWQTELRQEILREHVVKLCLKWPAAFSQPALSLPRDWMLGTAEARETLFGPTGTLPQTPDAFEAFLVQGDGVAGILRSIDQLFAPQTATRSALPLARPHTIFQKGRQENSVAAGHAYHPVLRSIEVTRGRGPLWSAAAIAYDISALWNGELPQAILTPGRAVVPAARGIYGVEARVEQGHITAFRRITPTDHLLAPGAALDQSLANLPRQKAEVLAPLVLAILDPCHPVSLEPVAGPLAREETTDA